MNTHTSTPPLASRETLTAPESLVVDPATASPALATTSTPLPAVDPLARAFEAIARDDALVLTTFREAICELDPQALAPLIEEALAHANFGVLSALLDALPFERIQTAVPDFLLLAALVDSSLDEPFVLNLLIHRGGLRYRPRPRKSRDRLVGEAARAFERALAAAADRSAAKLIADDYVASHQERRALEQAFASIPLQARALIDYGDCVLDATLRVGPEGLEILAIADALTGARARLARDQMDVALDTNQTVRAIRQSMAVAGQGTHEAPNASIESLLNAVLAGDNLALRDPGVLSAWRAASAAHIIRALDSRRRSRERDHVALAPSALRLDASAALARATIVAQRPQNGAELRRLAQVAQSDTLGNRVAAALNGRFGASPLFLSPSLAAASVASVMGLPAAAMASPMALVATLGTANAARAFVAPPAMSAAGANAQLALGLSPLHLAAMAGNSETVRELLAAGADAQATDVYGRTPLDVAVAAGVEDGELIADLEQGVAQEDLRKVAVWQAESREHAVLRAAHQAHAPAAETVDASAAPTDTLDSTVTEDANALDAGDPIDRAPSVTKPALGTTTQAAAAPDEVATNKVAAAPPSRSAGPRMH